jgi:hypothetical protein
MHIRRRALRVPLIAELTPSLQVTSAQSLTRTSWRWLSAHPGRFRAGIDRCPRAGE